MFCPVEGHYKDMLSVWFRYFFKLENDLNAI